MIAPVQREDTVAILAELRAASLFERQERVDAPIDAKRMVDERVGRAHAEKVRLVKAAVLSGATKSAIVAQLGIRNLSIVDKLLKEADSE